MAQGAEQKLPAGGVSKVGDAGVQGEVLAKVHHAYSIAQGTDRIKGLAQ